MLLWHCTFIYLIAVVVDCYGVATEKITFLSTEHAKLSYYNDSYLSFVNITSRRISRLDPRYYLQIHLYALRPINNNLLVNVYFYEFLSNRYMRGFIDLHYKFCDMVHKDLLFGRAIRQGKFAKPCPYPPGDYHLYNITFPLNQMPNNFPFTKGRMECNLTWMDNQDLIASAYVDMEIKTANLRKRKQRSN